MLLSPSSKIRSYTGPRTQWTPSFLWGGAGEGLGVGVVSCGSRLVHTPVSCGSRLVHDLRRAKHLGLLPPLIQLEKRSGEFRREQKVLSRISGLRPRPHARSCRAETWRQPAAIPRARGTGKYGRRVPEFLNPTKEHGFIQPQSGGKDAFDSEPACLS